MDAAGRGRAHELLMALTPEQVEGHYETLFLVGHLAALEATADAMGASGDAPGRYGFLAEALAAQAEENWWRSKLAVWQQAVVGVHWWEALQAVVVAEAEGKARHNEKENG